MKWYYLNLSILLQQPLKKPANMGRKLKNMTMYDGTVVEERGCEKYVCKYCGYITECSTCVHYDKESNTCVLQTSSIHLPAIGRAIHEKEKSSWSAITKMVSETGQLDFQQKKDMR